MVGIPINNSRASQVINVRYHGNLVELLIGENISGYH